MGFERSDVESPRRRETSHLYVRAFFKDLGTDQFEILFLRFSFLYQFFSPDIYVCVYKLFHLIVRVDNASMSIICRTPPNVKQL